MGNDPPGGRRGAGHRTTGDIGAVRAPTQEDSNFDGLVEHKQPPYGEGDSTGTSTSK